MLSCNLQSLDDFREEGHSITRSLTQELKHIRARDELIASSGRLKQLFNELTDVMIAAKEYQARHPSAEVHEFSQADHIASDQLREELNRIYRLDGAREIIEKCQEEALMRLDAYEKRKRQN